MAGPINNRSFSMHLVRETVGKITARRGLVSRILLAGWLIWGAARAVAPALPPADAPRPTSAEVAVEYGKYPQITKDPVYVNPELAALCVGISQAQVEAARITKGPHANAAVRIYMNALANEAFTRRATAYPVGAVVVKQKEFLPYRATVGGAKAFTGQAFSLATGEDVPASGKVAGPSTATGRLALSGGQEGEMAVHGSPSGVGGMIKRAPGYDPKHGNWEYFYFEVPTKIESGKIDSCVRCHAAAKSTDFVFGTWHRSP